VARAVGREVIVAASVAPVEDCYMPERVPDERTLGAEHGLMMQWLSAAAPDLVWIETMGTVREGRAAAVAAAEARLPHVVSFVPAESGSLLGGESLEDALAAVIGTGPLAVGVNCAPPSGVTAVLPRLRDSTALPLVAYAHINNVHPLRGWSYAERCSPDEYAAHAVAWLAAGAAVVGGCCGTTPAHVAAVRAWLDRM
jgi:S-methylmethionine-dependent homocysteine/selenocysteine methylase